MESLFPLPLVNVVVEIGRYVMHGTVWVAERRSTIHTPRGLCFQLLFRKRYAKLEEIFYTFLDRFIAMGLSVVFLESARFAH
jgi:hypothetical protein